MENLNSNEVFQYPDIAKELVEMARVDQEMRNSNKWDNSIDQRNTQRLKEIIEQIGWPTNKKVGRTASNLAWLIVQHADLDPQFQQECLDLMRTQEQGEVLSKHIAFLEDRVRVNTGRPTLYGTQFYTNKDGIYGPRETEDFENLDERRIKMGLEPFDEYKNKMLEKYGK